VQVVPTTVSFSDAWDGDDTLVYDPESTVAFILSECHVLATLPVPSTHRGMLSGGSLHGLAGCCWQGGGCWQGATRGVHRECV
jgi:hypothetical protein